MTELERFLVDRFLSDYRSNKSDEVGISSNAMLREAITGAERQYEDEDYPSDLGDLSRCCATFAKAPYSLKELMLPRLLAYCEYVGERKGLLPPAVEESRSRWSRILGWARS